METGVKRFLALGGRVARAQDAWLRAHPGVAVAARQRLLAREQDEKEAFARPRTSAWRLWGTVAAATTVAAALGIALRPPARPPLAFEVGPGESGVAEPGSGPARGTVGDWIAAPRQAALPLRFSDGSVILLDADARARVAEVTPRGARVVLERGAAHAHVAHREQTSWDIEAGPFDVRVVGTTFEVGWDPARELFTLILEQGKVAVGGCSLLKERVVAAGETFRATCRDGRSAPDSPPSRGGSTYPLGAASGPDRGSTPPPPSSVPGASERASPPPASRSPSAAPSAPAASRWENLLASGRYPDALDAAEAEGLSAVCARADITALAKLGDAARFADRADAAGVIFRSLRERFPDDERASVAAFHLGRMAFDRSAYDDARGWFDVYLNERPAGPLAREASGRVVEALDRAGDHVRAREAAGRYLDAFPNGPHAQFARSVLTR